MLISPETGIVSGEILAWQLFSDEKIKYEAYCPYLKKEGIKMLFRKICRTAFLLVLTSNFTCHAMAINTCAASAVLMEQDSGRVLYEQCADDERLIASITKIMTAIVALEHGDINETYTVTVRDMAEGSSMYLKTGDVLTLEELLYGLMLASGNDAALAVAHCVCGEVSDFVALMNETARALGMMHTSFANPNGLDAEGHYSSARDMAVLSAYALKNETFLRIVSTSSITIGDRFLKNHNKLLNICEGCIGVKTGFTKAAGRTLVSAVERNGMTLICVTLNDGDDWNDHMALMEYGFEAFHLTIAACAGQKLTDVPVRSGSSDSVKLMAAKDLAYPVTGTEKLTVKLRVPVSVSAPVMVGQVIGQAAFYLDGQEVASVDLVAAEWIDKFEAEEDEGFLSRLLN